MTSNPRIPKDEDQGTDWSATALPRIYPNSADPRGEIQPPVDQGWIPNVDTTPPPPDVWMAGTGQSQQQQLHQLLRAIQILRAGT